MKKRVLTLKVVVRSSPIFNFGNKEVLSNFAGTRKIIRGLQTLFNDTRQEYDSIVSVN